MSSSSSASSTLRTTGAAGFVAWLGAADEILGSVINNQDLALVEIKVEPVMFVPGAGATKWTHSGQ